MKSVSTILLFFLFFTVIIHSQWITVPSSPAGFIQNIVEVNNTIFLSHSSNGVYKSTDGMVSFQMISNGLNNTQARNVSEMLFYNGNLYAATIDGIYKSTDDGNNWVKKSNGISIGPGSAYEFTGSIFQYNGSLFTGAFNGIYCSTDNAENWIITNVTGQHIRAKNFTEHNGILFAARESINDPSGYKSFDGGLTWESLPTSPLYSTITFFSEPDKLWCGTIHGAWLSTDNGLTWEERSNGLSPDPYNSCIMRINGRLVTSLKFGGSGIFRSSDEGVNWEDFGDALPFLSSIEKIIVYEDKIVAATSNGLWQRDTTEIISQIEMQNSLSLNEFKLQQSYPNPFNPSTTIKYSIPNSDNVSLKVFDILGREVDVLVDEYKSAGTYSVEFSTKGGSASGGNTYNLTSGIYFYQLKAGFLVETKKMTLLK